MILLESLILAKINQVQIMEILVDTLTVLAPWALYVQMGTFNIASTGLLTLFFKGLLELSKSFLDPFGREGYRAHNIRVDVLVSEMNFGASSRWVDAGDVLPSELLEKHESGESTLDSPPLQESTPETDESSPEDADGSEVFQLHDMLIQRVNGTGTEITLKFNYPSEVAASVENSTSDTTIAEMTQKLMRDLPNDGE